MSSGFLNSLVALLVLTSPASAAEQLRVCADPNNLPFSNDAKAGFENRIVSIVAQELGAQLVYVWWAQRRGLITDGLDTGACDLIAGTGDARGVLLTYPPYYRSTYAFVTKVGTAPVSSFDDPALRTLRIGVQLIGEDGNNSPPAMALARRGIIANVTGFPVFGDYAQPNPASRIIDAVADGSIDVAVAWGPLAGYFAKREQVPLRVTPAASQFDTPQLPMAFDISMAVRLDEGDLRMRVERALAKRSADIDAILAEYGVPRLDWAVR